MRSSEGIVGESGEKRLGGLLAPSARAKTLLAAYAVGATALGGLLAWLVVRNVHWGELGASLASADMRLIAAALAATLIAGYLRGVRWHILLKDPSPGPGRLFMIEQAGAALDTLSPVRVLDEVVQTGILMFRDKIPLGTILATLALQRAFEFAATALALGCGALLLPQLRQFWPLFAAGIAIGAISLILLFAAGPALARAKALSKMRIAPQFSAALLLLKREKRRAVAAFALSAAQTLLIGIAGWLVAVATQLDMSLPAMIVISLAVLFFSSVTPSLPMALGSFEFAALYLLGLWGIGREQAIAFSLALHIVLFAPPILFALAFLPREGLHSARQIRALARDARAEISTARGAGDGSAAPTAGD